MRRTLLFACCLAGAAAAQAEERCRVVLGADAMRLVGDSSERALKVCPVPSSFLHDLPAVRRVALAGRRLPLRRGNRTL